MSEVTMIWKLEDAKNRFSEVVRRAGSEGPQFVTKHGRETAVVLGVHEYQALAGANGPLLDFLTESPFGDAVRDGALNVERLPDFPRDVEL
jgi:toxin FitB